MGGAACKAKIILNGRTVQSELVSLCYLVEETPEESIPYTDGLAMVKLLNLAEDAVFAAKRLYLESQGFEGPWPASLDNPAVARLVNEARKEKAT